MDSLSEEELTARLTYLNDQKALEKVAAESAKREMRINEERETIRRLRQNRSQPNAQVKTEPGTAPNERIKQETDSAGDNDPSSRAQIIRYNETVDLTDEPDSPTAAPAAAPTHGEQAPREQSSDNTSDMPGSVLHVGEETPTALAIAELLNHPGNEAPVSPRNSEAPPSFRATTPVGALSYDPPMDTPTPATNRIQHALADFLAAPPAFPTSLFTSTAQSAIPQSAGTTRKREDSEDTPLDDHYFGLLVEDRPDHLNEFRTICRAPQGDGYVEPRCYYCHSNYGRDTHLIVLFKGIIGFQSHIINCHPSKLVPGEILTLQKVLELCTYRSLSETGKQMVDNRDPLFKVEKVLSKGADFDAPVTQPRRKRPRHSANSVDSSDVTDTIAVRSRSLSTLTISAHGDTEFVDAAEEMKCDHEVDEPASESTGETPPLQQTLGMVTRRGGRRD